MKDSQDTYTVFVIQGHEGQTPQMTLVDVCTMEIIADSLDEAMKIAKKLVKKSHYRCQSVIQQFRKK